MNMGFLKSNFVCAITLPWIFFQHTYCIPITLLFIFYRTLDMINQLPFVEILLGNTVCLFVCLFVYRYIFPYRALNSSKKKQPKCKKEKSYTILSLFPHFRMICILSFSHLHLCRKKSYRFPSFLKKEMFSSFTNI